MRRLGLAFVLLLLAPLASAQVVINPGGGSTTTTTADTVSAAITCTDAVGTDAYACSATNCPAALADSQTVIFEAGTLNTGPATFAFCGFTAKAVVRYIGGISTALVTGDILAKQPVAVRYDAGDDNWKMFSVPASAGLLTAANTWTGIQTFSVGQVFTSGQTVTLGANATFGRLIPGNGTQTPDSNIWTTGTTSESLNIFQDGDVAFDFNNGRCGTSACTNPSWIIHSSDQSTTEYAHISADTTGAAGFQSNFAELRVGGTKSAITEGSAQAIVRFGIPTGTNVFGATVFYSVYDLNGANYVVRSGQVRIQGGNASGTATCTINASQDTEAEDGSQIATSNAYTLTYTWTNVVATTNCDLSLNASSSAGTNTYGVTWTAVVTGNAAAVTVTGQ